MAQAGELPGTLRVSVTLDAVVVPASVVCFDSPADRRIVHQVATDAAGITTVSEGEGRERHVIIQLEEAE